MAPQLPCCLLNANHTALRSCQTAREPRRIFERPFANNAPPSCRTTCSELLPAQLQTRHPQRCRSLRETSTHGLSLQSLPSENYGTLVPQTCPDPNPSLFPRLRQPRASGSPGTMWLCGPASQEPPKLR